jgi:acyl-CoA reductase-like NAD-dependent aldehyde dehydrogenase
MLVFFPSNTLLNFTPLWQQDARKYRKYPSLLLGILSPYAPFFMPLQTCVNAASFCIKIPTFGRKYKKVEMTNNDKNLKGSYSLGWNTLPKSEQHSILDKWEGTVLSTVDFTNKAGVRQVGAHAMAAFREAAQSSYEQRHQLIRLMIKGIEAQREAFIACIEKEAGKTYGYAEAEFNRSILTLESGAAFCFQPKQEGVQIDFGKGVGKRAWVERVGMGPVLAFCPFNFPLNLLLHKLVPAWVAGCPVVVKPSPETPLTALLLAAVFDSLGKDNIHPGMLQVVLCSNEDASALVEDTRYAVFSFTGSDTVGWELKSKCNRKKVLLELGGIAPMIVAPDASLEKASSALVGGAFLYSGQTCISTQHVFVHSSQKTEFIRQFKAEVSKQSEALACPLIHPGALNRIKKWLESVEKKGAMISPLSQHRLPQNALPFYLVEGLPYLDELAQAELFGPAVCLHTYDEDLSLIALLNQSRFGLQAALFTHDLERIKRYFQLLETGALLVNEVAGFRIDTMPYGGVKDSGFGREGVAYAFEEMTERKLLVW